MTDRELMQLALDALDSDNPHIQVGAAISLRYRLAQPEPKTNWIRVTKKDVHGNEISWFKPKGEWVGLTDEDVAEAYNRDEFWWMQMRDISHEDLKEFVTAIEAKLKEKNT